MIFLSEIMSSFILLKKISFQWIKFEWTGLLSQHSLLWMPLNIAL